MIITADLLRKMTTANRHEKNLVACAPYLDLYMPRAGLDAVNRAACFFGQLLHECGEFRYMEELASGQAYETRRDLGNIAAGDGKRFKGRGLFQLTGRANYAEFARYADNPEIMIHPELVARPDLGTLAAVHFWMQRPALNRWADAFDVRAVTHIVNGGENGLAERIAFTNVALDVLAEALD